jgi:hypothetical protein
MCSVTVQERHSSLDVIDHNSRAIVLESSQMYEFRQVIHEHTTTDPDKTRSFLTGVTTKPEMNAPTHTQKLNTTGSVPASFTLGSFASAANEPLNTADPAAKTNPSKIDMGRTQLVTILNFATLSALKEGRIRYQIDLC